MSTPAAAAAPPSPFSMRNPYPAKRLDNLRLTGPDSDKDTRHHAISLGDSGIFYHPGDALGLIATNCPELAQDLVKALGAKGTELVPDKNKQPKPLLEALIQDYVINFIDQKFVEAAVARGVSDQIGRATCRDSEIKARGGGECL